MTEKKQNHKRIFLVNRDFQLRYTRAAIGVGILSTALTTTIILYPLYTFEILRIPRFLPTPILATMAMACLVNIVFLAIMGIFVTHKIAGPMYSLVRHFRLVGMARFGDKMRIREDDELKFVVRNFNEMIDDLCSLTRSDLAALERVSDLISGTPDNKVLTAVNGEVNGLRTRISNRLKSKAGPADQEAVDPSSPK